MHLMPMDQWLLVHRQVDQSLKFLDVLETHLFLELVVMLLIMYELYSLYLV
ncbi:unnamed protein product [Trichobilharzia regenti]|nr:unnamed protein product [Trichobilharzia regenti]